jgi:hypothetical protein
MRDTAVNSHSSDGRWFFSYEILMGKYIPVRDVGEGLVFGGSIGL